MKKRTKQEMPFSNEDSSLSNDENGDDNGARIVPDAKLGKRSKSTNGKGKVMQSDDPVSSYLETSHVLKPLAQVIDLVFTFFDEEILNLVIYRHFSDQQKALVDRLLQKILSPSGMEKYRIAKGSSLKTEIKVETQDLGYRTGSETLRKENLIKIAMSYGLRTIKNEYKNSQKISKSHRTGYYISKSTVCDMFFREYFGSDYHDTDQESLKVHRVVGGLTKSFFFRLIGKNYETPKLGLIKKIYWLLSNDLGRQQITSHYRKSIRSKLERCIKPQYVNFEAIAENPDFLFELAGQRIESTGLKLPKTISQFQQCLDLAQNKLKKLSIKFGLDLDHLTSSDPNIQNPNYVSEELTSKPHLGDSQSNRAVSKKPTLNRRSTTSPSFEAKEEEAQVGKSDNCAIPSKKKK